VERFARLVEPRHKHGAFLFGQGHRMILAIALSSTLGAGKCRRDER
jgi:hypothetical protein